MSGCRWQVQQVELELSQGFAMRRCAYCMRDTQPLQLTLRAPLHQRPAAPRAQSLSMIVETSVGLAMQSSACKRAVLCSLAHLQSRNARRQAADAGGIQTLSLLIRGNGSSGSS